MSKLLITGGILRSNGYKLGEGKYYDEAVLYRLDTKTSDIEKCLSITEGNENFPDENPNLEFTVGTYEPNTLWLTTDTEIRRYDYPSLKLKDTYSHPCFQNIHSVAIRDQQLYVTSTGLDMVVVLNKSTGAIDEIINTEGKSSWHRFNESTDYRKIHSTKPHDCHPNYVFWIDDVPWVTRCTQGDAVCLSDVSKRINVSGDDRSISIHDGIVMGDEVLFTTVDGCVVIADVNSYNIKETIELYDLPGYGGIRGWCRGLFQKDNLIYIGFSRLRKTKSTGKLAWLAEFANRGAPSKQASILVFDFDKRKIVRDYALPEDGIDAIYTILPEPI
ncbi:MAG: hypothetical protein GY777_22340 [Candidatus Brocadiaceae bacterium]|nr:hypothetical protein [Candidatus Brocadiaceae bacterium]